MQNHKKYTLEAYNYWLEKKEVKIGVTDSFRTNKHKTSMVKQKKTLKTFDGERCLSLIIIVYLGSII